uniref:3-oxoacyl-[acyl-carrier-protein] reductase n=1 Tax=Magallana gigas TaxID=29159 RepID=A0A8W8P0V2_MAGGI
MTLEGKTAPVVGFASAIGSSIATSLANAGCDIIGVDKAKQDSVHISIDKIKKSRLSVSKIEEFPDDNWEDDLNVNMTAPFMVIKQLLGSMKENGWRRIIHISTICGPVALRNVSSYIASKSGLIGLTRIADLVLFLCSPGKNMTGTAIAIHGGITVS